MATREQLEQEAEERYPLDRRQVMFSGVPFPRPERAAFIAGRTVSPEQFEAAVERVHEALCQQARDGDVEIEVFSHGITLERDMTRAAFRAAGFYIEGEE